MQIKELDWHCGECDSNIASLCDEFCNYQEGEIALCKRREFEEMDTSEYEKLYEMLEEEEEEREQQEIK